MRADFWTTCLSVNINVNSKLLCWIHLALTSSDGTNGGTGGNEEKDGAAMETRSTHPVCGAGHLDCSNVKSSCCSCTGPVSLSIRLTSGSAFQRNSLWTSYEGDPSSQYVVCVSTINTSHSLQAAAEPATRSCHPQFTQRDSAHVRKWICASRNAGDFLLGTESPQALKTRFKASGNEFNQCVCFLSL